MEQNIQNGQQEFRSKIKIAPSIVRSLIAIALGMVLVLWPGAAAKYVIIFVGVALIGSGVIALISYFNHPKETRVGFIAPVSGIAALVIGIIFVGFPEFFVSAFMFIIGIVILIAGISQIFMIGMAGRAIKIPVTLYITSILVLIGGVVVLFNPFKAVEVLIMFIGGVSMFYGIIDIVTVLNLRNRLR